MGLPFPEIVLQPAKIYPVLYQTFVFKVNGVPAVKDWPGAHRHGLVLPDVPGVLPKVTVYVLPNHFA